MARSHGLADGDVVVTRTTLEELQGALYCLQAAIEDVDRDLAVGRPTAAEVREALDWLLVNARPAADCWVEPRTASLHLT